MSGSVNKVIIVGRAGRDPEIRFTQAGDKIAQLSVATSETWREKSSGERKEKTEWHRVVIFNPHLADLAEKFVKKGALIGIEGQLQTRKWTDQSGSERYTTEVVLSRFRGELTLLDKPDRDGDGHSERGAGQGGFDDDLDSDQVPF